MRQKRGSGVYVPTETFTGCLVDAANVPGAGKPGTATASPAYQLCLWHPTQDGFSLSRPYLEPHGPTQ